MRLIELPKRELTSMLSTKINRELLTEIKRRKPKGISLRDVVEFGLRVYLEQLNETQGEQLEMYEKN